MLERFTQWLHTAHHDPITGDALSTLEYLTRQVQVVVRTPWFIIAFNAFTLACMILQRMDAWNWVASWLAIIIEWLVGTYFFGQTARDAIVTRETRRISLRVERLERKELDELRELWGLDPPRTTPQPTRKRDKRHVSKRPTR